MMRKVVINTGWGGFGLSTLAFEKYLDIKGLTWYKYSPAPHPFGYTYYSVPRDEYTKIMAHATETGDYSATYGLIYVDYQIPRDDEVLIKVVEELGELANGDYTELAIFEIPEDVKWHIDDYDGREWIAEDHRTWGRN